MSDVELDRDIDRDEPQPYYQYGKPASPREPPPERRPDMIGLDLPSRRPVRREADDDAMDRDGDENGNGNGNGKENEEGDGIENENGNGDDNEAKNGGRTKQDDEVQDVVYEVTEKPSFHVTRALFIGNLRKPLNAGDFQRYLRSLAESNKDIKFNIDRAWLNRLRTHAIVLVSNEEGAEFLRSQLSGSIYPGEEEDLRLKEEFENRETERFEHEKRIYDDLSEEEKEKASAPVEPREFFTDRLPLYVEYIPVKAIGQWTFEEDKGPRDGIWKLEFTTRNEEIVASHLLLNGDYIPQYRPPSYRGGRGRGRDNYGPPRYRGGHDRYVPGRSERGPYSRERRGGNGNYSRGGHYGGHTDSYVPGRSRDARPQTDSYVPSRHRDRSRSRSRSPSRF
ncbi:hypothetical protein PVL30_004917 [Lodderomyces elongisporus]|uniref:uncharacterized protein n=1 Tax=Lodderomyces elongisporus TaxID=36914 RepID=UPI002923CFFB|nr:uncharacterized protein PVL30_004917 [Lodderomyces elongisporus]WLF81120.1 hypothetical protein PVL30_004917 [Lodderomyces elongisporus]